MLPYRIHDLPDPEKLENLSQFIARFGYKVRTSGTKTDISKSINHLLDDIHGKKEENPIETVSIRAMQKHVIQLITSVLRTGDLRILHSLYFSHPPFPGHDGTPFGDEIYGRRTQRIRS